jgi:hypothetical protein
MTYPSDWGGIFRLTILALVTAACSGATMSTPMNLRSLPETIESVAMAPSGGVLADAIGTELFNRGFQVIDTQETSNYLVRLNLDEIELMQPKSLTAMRGRGIKAILSVRAVAGYDNKPQSASVRVVSTQTGEVVAAVTWQNGQGGARGSPADAMMRKDIVGAAQQIAQSLVIQLRRK